MKKNIFILTFTLFCVSTIFSQDWFVGGSASIQYDSRSSNEGIYLALSPEIGYGIKNKLDMGINPFFAYDSLSSNETDIISLGIGFFARYSYF